MSASTTEISKEKNPKTMNQHVKVAESGGNVAKAARKELENKLNRSIISPAKASDYLPDPKSPKNSNKILRSLGSYKNV